MALLSYQYANETGYNHTVADNDPTVAKLQATQGVQFQPTQMTGDKAGTTTGGVQLYKNGDGTVTNKVPDTTSYGYTGGANNSFLNPNQALTPAEQAARDAATKPNTLTSDGATADYNNTRTVLDQQKTSLQTQLTNAEAGINRQYDTLDRQQQAQQKEESATNAAVQFRLGREATPYAQSATEKLDQVHADQMNTLTQQRQSALANAEQAFSDGNIELAKQYIANDKELHQQQRDLAQQQAEQRSRAIQDANAVGENIAPGIYQTVQDNPGTDVGQLVTDYATKNGLDPNLLYGAYQKYAIAQGQQKAKDTYEQVTKPINDLAAEAAKFNAPQSVLNAISGAKTIGEAISLAGGYLQDPTSIGGMYSAYLKSAKATGQTPLTPDAFVAAQKYADALATQKAQSAYSYADAYNAAAGRLAAEAKYASSSAGQQKLEKEYTANLIKELSNRSGNLGLQDAKVNQAIHLKALIDQNVKTDPNGTKHYNLTPQQQEELAIGMANLVAGTTGAAQATIDNINAKTAAGDFAGAIQYITGVPQKGNTDAILKNLEESIIRQGETAEDLRSQYLAQFRASKPTDLSDERAKQVEKIQDFSSIKNPEKNVANAAQQADGTLKTYMTSHPDKVAEINTKETALKQKLGHAPSAVEFQIVYPEYFSP